MYGDDEIETVQLVAELEKVRRETRTTMREMAFLCDVSPHSYRCWIYRKTVPSIRRLNKLRSLQEYFSKEENREKQLRKSLKRIKEKNKLLSKLRSKED